MSNSRLVGPYSHQDADHLVERVLDDTKFRNILMKFATGDIEAEYMVTVIQNLFEDHETLSEEKEGLDHE